MEFKSLCFSRLIAPHLHVIRATESEMSWAHTICCSCLHVLPLYAHTLAYVNWVQRKEAHTQINVFSDNSRQGTVPRLWEKFPVSQTPAVMGSTWNGCLFSWEMPDTGQSCKRFISQSSKILRDGFHRNAMNLSRSSASRIKTLISWH